jgi:hypothetical protein
VANDRNMLGTTEYIFYCKRAILFLSSSKILTPHPPLRPASVFLPPLLRGEDRLAGRREGVGGSIFWKTREIGLPSYSKICTCTLCLGLRRWMSFCPLILSPSISFSVVLQDGGKKWKRKKNIDHHGQRTIPNICHLPDADSPSHVYSYRACLKLCRYIYCNM